MDDALVDLSDLSCLIRPICFKLNQARMVPGY
jgi:hypothetical protein